MKYFSSLKYLVGNPITSGNSNNTYLRVVGLVVLLLMSGSASGIFLQQSKGKKVKPTASGTINIQEIQKREAENPTGQERKKIENDNLIIPPDLPVPKGAKGKTFRPPHIKRETNPGSQSHRSKRKKGAGCTKTHRR